MALGGALHTQEEPECGHGLRTAEGLITHSLALLVSTVLSSSLPVSPIPSDQLPLRGRKHGLQQHPVSLERKLNFLPQIKKKKKKISGKDSDWLSLGLMLIRGISQPCGGGQQGEMAAGSSEHSHSHWGPIQLSRPQRGVSPSASEDVRGCPLTHLVLFLCPGPNVCHLST